MGKFTRVLHTFRIAYIQEFSVLAGFAYGNPKADAAISFFGALLKLTQKV
jgi:hypothetical protein